MTMTAEVLTELHIKKAIDVSNLFPEPSLKDIKDGVLESCKYFTVEKLVCDGDKTVKISNKSFQSLIITEGCGRIELDDNVTEVKRQAFKK